MRTLSREGCGIRLIARNESDEKLVLMLLNLFQRQMSVPLLNIRRGSQLEQAIGQLNDGQRPQLIAQAFNCYARIVQLLRERYNLTNSIKTELSVVVIEGQRHVRISTSFESIWIIDSLQPRTQYDRQLATTRDELVTALSDVILIYKMFYHSKFNRIIWNNFLVATFFLSYIFPFCWWLIKTLVKVYLPFFTYELNGKWFTRSIIPHPVMCSR